MVALGVGGYVRLGASGWLLVAGPRAPAGPLSLLVAGLGGKARRGGVGGVGRRRGHARRRAAPDRRRWAVGAGLAPAPTASSRAAVPRGDGRGARGRRDPPAALRPGLAALEQGALAPAIRLLAGRGDGLTPAGDDVLAGYAAWTLAAGEPATLSALAAPRCSPIGLAYLRCAERGEVPEPATALIGAVRRGDARAAGRHADALGSWGSSSGAALVWGMAAALGALPA